MLLFNRERLLIPLISALLLVTVGCGGDEVGSINLAPQIFVFEVESDIVEPGSQVPVTIEVADLEGNPITFEWSATGGTISGDLTGALWTAPEQERKYQIELSVSDGAKSTTSTIDIQVWRTRPGNYYPLAVGNRWTYRDDEGNRIIFAIIDKIQIHLSEDELIDSFVLEKSSTDENLENVKNYSYIGQNFNEDGVVNGIVQHAQNIASGTDGTMLFLPFLPLYNFPLIPGNKWATSFQAEIVPERLPLGNGLDEFEVLSEETVTVPAGTFNNVFQVQESFRWTFFDAQDLDITVVKKWLAPDVGIVKFTQLQTRFNVTVEVFFELESFELLPS
ncbi:MAG: hypothetical protein OXT74_06290 [Candidatus Poribacteria bacterium]|nr:hypothetical protein [Candidatus Poribacteria bacterium]